MSSTRQQEADRSSSRPTGGSAAPRPRKCCKIVRKFWAFIKRVVRLILYLIICAIWVVPRWVICGIFWIAAYILVLIRQCVLCCFCKDTFLPKMRPIQGVHLAEDQKLLQAVLIKWCSMLLRYGVPVNRLEPLCDMYGKEINCTFSITNKEILCMHSQPRDLPCPAPSIAASNEFITSLKTEVVIHHVGFGFQYHLGAIDACTQIMHELCEKTRSRQQQEGMCDDRTDHGDDSQEMTRQSSSCEILKDTFEKLEKLERKVDNEASQYVNLSKFLVYLSEEGSDHNGTTADRRQTGLQYMPLLPLSSRDLSDEDGQGDYCINLRNVGHLLSYPLSAYSQAIFLKATWSEASVAAVGGSVLGIVYKLVLYFVPDADPFHPLFTAAIIGAFLTTFVVHYSISMMLDVESLSISGDLLVLCALQIELPSYQHYLGVFETFMNVRLLSGGSHLILSFMVLILHAVGSFLGSNIYTEHLGNTTVTTLRSPAASSPASSQATTGDKLFGKQWWLGCIGISLASSLYLRAGWFSEHRNCCNAPSKLFSALCDHLAALLNTLLAFAILEIMQSEVYAERFGGITGPMSDTLDLCLATAVATAACTIVAIVCSNVKILPVRSVLLFPALVSILQASVGFQGLLKWFRNGAEEEHPILGLGNMTFIAVAVAVGRETGRAVVHVWDFVTEYDSEGDKTIAQHCTSLFQSDVRKTLTEKRKEKRE